MLNNNIKLNELLEKGFEWKEEYIKPSYDGKVATLDYLKTTFSRFDVIFRIKTIYNCGCSDFDTFFVSEIDECLFEHSEYSYSNYEVFDDELVLIHWFVEHVDEMCFNCEMDAEDWRDVSDLNFDGTKFANMDWCHGLCTGFSGYVEEDEVFSRADYVTNAAKCNKDTHICTTHSSQMIGPIGLVLTGEVVMASNIDLWSRTNANTHKEIDINKDAYIYGRIDDPEDFDFSMHSHTEILVRPTKIKAVWIRETSTFAMKLEKKIKAYARALDVPVYYINEKDIVTHVVESTIALNNYDEYESLLPMHTPMWA